MKKKIKPLHAVLGWAGLSARGVILAGFLGSQALFYATLKLFSNHGEAEWSIDCAIPFPNLLISQSPF